MVMELVLMTVTLGALLVASYVDLKVREVPDWVSYGLVFAALGIRLIFSFTHGFSTFLSGLLGFGVFFALAYLFYLTNQWGGGDSKLLMGMGAVIGVTYPFDVSSFDLAIFFILLLLVGAVYGVVYMLVLALWSWKKFWPSFTQKLKQYMTLQIVLIVVTLCIASAMYYTPWVWPLLLFPLPFFYLFHFVHATEESCFISKISTSKLTEGDWLAKPVTRNGKTLIVKKTIQKSDIAKLKKYHVSHVTIKQGIPFVPSFLIAYVLLVIGMDYLVDAFRYIFI